MLKMPPHGRVSFSLGPERFCLNRCMTTSTAKTRRASSKESVGPEILLVRIPQTAVHPFSPESFSQVNTGLEAVQLLKLLRFKLLLASMDLPDMRPWDLFRYATQTQPHVRCVLIDDRITMKDEQHIRESGAAIYDPRDPRIAALISGALGRNPKGAKKSPASRKPVP